MLTNDSHSAERYASKQFWRILRIADQLGVVIWDDRCCDKICPSNGNFLARHHKLRNIDNPPIWKVDDRRGDAK